MTTDWVLDAGPAPFGKDKDPLDGEQFLRVAWELWQLAKQMFASGGLSYAQLATFADLYPSGLSFIVEEDGAEVRLFYGSVKP